MTRALSAAACFFFWASSACAESLTWDDAVAEARRNHPDLASAREAVRGAEASWSQTAGALWPQVGAGIDAGRSKTVSAAGIPSRADSYSYSISGSQLLFDGFKTHFDANSADREVEARRAEEVGTSAFVRFRLREAFTELQKAQELLSITQKIAERRRQSRDLLKTRYDAGREHKGSLLTAEANLAQADFEVGQAVRAIAVSRRRLAKELGRARGEPLQAAGVLEVPASKEEGTPDFDRLAGETPSVRALTARLEAARWGVRSSWSDFFPTVSADGSIGRSSSRWPPAREDWSAGVSFSVPLFEGGNLVAGVARANAALAQAKADERSGRDAAVLDLEEAWKGLVDAEEQVSVQEKFLEAARERSRIAESEYSTGLVTFNDWIIIEDNLVRTEKTYVDARAQAVTARAAWDQARGVTLDED